MAVDTVHSATQVACGPDVLLDLARQHRRVGIVTNDVLGIVFLVLAHDGTEPFIEGTSRGMVRVGGRTRVGTNRFRIRFVVLHGFFDGLEESDS
jgi:hypothetical protein